MKRFILWLLTPIQKILQNTGNKEPLMQESQVLAIKSVVRPGDILLSYETGRPTSKLIKGYYDHAAIVTSELTVMEAVGSGVREVPLHQWLQTKDSVCVIRPIYHQDETPFFNDIINKTAAANSYFYKGRKYDYQFSGLNEDVYCSELVYLCYIKEDKNFLNEITSDEILPHDYYDLTKRESIFHLISEYRNA